MSTAPTPLKAWLATACAGQKPAGLGVLARKPLEEADQLARIPGRRPDGPDRRGRRDRRRTAAPATTASLDVERTGTGPWRRRRSPGCRARRRRRGSSCRPDSASSTPRRRTSISPMGELAGPRCASSSWPTRLRATTRPSPSTASAFTDVVPMSMPDRDLECHLPPAGHAPTVSDACVSPEMYRLLAPATDRSTGGRPCPHCPRSTAPGCSSPARRRASARRWPRCSPTGGDRRRRGPPGRPARRGPRAALPRRTRRPHACGPSTWPTPRPPSGWPLEAWDALRPPRRRWCTTRPSRSAATCSELTLADGRRGDARQLHVARSRMTPGRAPADARARPRRDRERVEPRRPPRHRRTRPPTARRKFALVRLERVAWPSTSGTPASTFASSSPGPIDTEIWDLPDNDPAALRRAVRAARDRRRRRSSTPSRATRSSATCPT